ncbi:hypothetical protein E4U13_001568 [Claviceps humidiphila]|uniref:Tim44-like domain-containing protein n=1 Tax=Claviceps humidiphila TaxID=1294629 RepID=A0A9P7TR42_9HYPO|nr:hypothetical protein E4U13_001568 [Claviceps humidiphila]
MASRTMASRTMASLTSRWGVTTSHTIATTKTTMTARRLVGMQDYALPGSSNRHYASAPRRSKAARDLERAIRLNDKKSEVAENMSDTQRKTITEYLREGANLIPATFVSLPISQYPRTPLALFVKYHFVRLTNWVRGISAFLIYKGTSMSSYSSRPRYQPRRRKIAGTAKAMYRELLEAYAAGDRKTLDRLCLGNFTKRLSAALDRRKSSESVRFELMKYNKRWAYPMLMSHMIGPNNPYDKALLTEQAVVAIASTQKMLRVDTKTNQMIPGTLKVQDKLEYVVLQRQINMKTWEMPPWRIWGTTSATTMEAYLKEKAVNDEMMANRLGFDTSSANKTKK